MQRFLAFSAFAVVAATLTGTANAASFKGVVVAKDAKRTALVIASPRAIRTVRARSQYTRFRIGQRITVNGRRLRDGTFTARSVRPTGRTKRVRFRAVVVRSRSARLIVSGGSSVFVLRMRGLKTRAVGNDGKLGPGDTVNVDADIKDGHLEADDGDVDETGHVSALELEGIFLYTTKDGFALAVVHRGLVNVAVPDGMIVPPFKPGDQIEVIVRVGENGSFTFMKGRQDERDYGKGKEKGEYKAEGVLVGKSPLSVSVRGGHGTLTCAIPAGLELSSFRIGEKAKLICVSRDGDLVMIKLRTENGEVRGDGSGQLGVYGVLTAKSATSIRVRREDTTLTTCAFAAPLDLSLFRVGEHVKLHCNLEASRWMFGSLWGESASIDEHGMIEQYVYGALQAQTGSEVAVRRSDGSLFGCNAPAELNLSYFRADEHVKLRCRLDGGTRTLLSVNGERYSVGADGSAELHAYGTLTGTTDSSVIVTAEDAATFTCTYPAGLDLSRFPTGTHVKLHCHLLEGSFRLEYMKSDSAVVEVGH